MIGAIAGDIVGSVYEFHNIKTKDFPLFTDQCFFTDDSVLTIALADALLTGKPYVQNLKTFYRW
jgi:ADP-ribosylglycohydrolase